MLLPSDLHPPLSAERIRQLSPAALAYLGDAVYELYVRRLYLYPPQRSEPYHRQVVERVKSEAQAQRLEDLLPVLSPAERDIVMWGRNGAGRGPRQVPAERYRLASGLETLLGYLYLTDPDRLSVILKLSDSVESPARFKAEQLSHGQFFTQTPPNPEGEIG